MTNAVKTQGTQFKRGDGADPEVFTKVGEVVGISGPSGEAAEIDATSFDSTAMEFILGLPDEGNVTLNCIYDPTSGQQTGLRTDRNAGTLRNFQIVLNDTGSTTISFAGYVKSWSLDAQPNSKWDLSCNLRISGAISIA